jgi:hypothetical protein
MKRMKFRFKGAALVFHCEITWIELTKGLLQKIVALRQGMVL